MTTQKNARAGTGASGTTLLLTYQKHSKGIALAQHDSNAHFDEIALATEVTKKLLQMRAEAS